MTGTFQIIYRRFSVLSHIGQCSIFPKWRLVRQVISADLFNFSYFFRLEKRMAVSGSLTLTPHVWWMLFLLWYKVRGRNYHLLLFYQTLTLYIMLEEVIMILWLYRLVNLSLNFYIYRRFSCRYCVDLS